MIHGMTLGILHQFVNLLLYPVLIGLAFGIMLSLWELGITFAEKFFTLSRYQQQDQATFGAYASYRLERSDLLSRCGPILGLMGTLIPLGPGLTALGNGNMEILATALTVAFDTTVVGLLIGLVNYCISRMRRRWYDDLWQSLPHEPAQNSNQ